MDTDPTQSTRHDERHEPGSQFIGIPIDSYVPVAYLGAGGMGQVFEARRDGWQIRYALKILEPHQGAREIEVHQHFRHPNVVSVVDGGTFTDDEGRTRQYIVMELVQGARSITRYADERHLSLDERVGLMIQVCRGLEEEIHRKGARHFDIKPSNLLVDDHAVVRISDLGLSRLGTDIDVKRVGGTQAYMAPEQFERSAADLDDRADIYAVGATLYELASGHPPHDIPSSCPESEMLAIKRRAPAPIDHERRLDAIIRRCLEHDRDDRYSSISRLREDLESWLAARTATGNRVRHAVIGAWERPLARGVALTLIGAIVATLLGGLVTSSVWRVVRWETIVPAPTIDRYEQVRLIVFPDAAEVERLAADLGIDGVSASDVASWRLLHAALCDRLAGVASVTAFDYHFLRPHMADETFASSIRASFDRGTPVVGATKGCFVSDEGSPQLSPALFASGIQWGHWQISAGRSWVPILFSNDARSYPSLSLATVSAMHEPRGMPEYRIADDKVNIRYWRPSDTRENWRAFMRSQSNVEPTELDRYDPATQDFESVGAQLDDAIAWMRVDAPPESERHAGTLDLRHVFESDDALLELGNKAVIVFDQRDPQRWLGDDMGPSAYIHAAAMEGMLTGRQASWVHRWQQVGVMIPLGILGVWIGYGAGAIGASVTLRSTAFRWLIALVIMAMIVAILVWIFNAAMIRLASSTLILLNPVPGACTLTVGALLGLSTLVFRPCSRSHRVHATTTPSGTTLT